jgi:hypothetical protein
MLQAVTVVFLQICLNMGWPIRNAIAWRRQISGKIAEYGILAAVL